jgi:hypothetical protein
MLSGVLKFSQRTPVDEAGGLGCGMGRETPELTQRSKSAGNTVNNGVHPRK